MLSTHPAEIGVTGVLECAERALPWLEAMAAERAGGQAAHARTLARCGRAGRIAFSMLGKRPTLLPVGSADMCVVGKVVRRGIGRGQHMCTLEV